MESEILQRLNFKSIQGNSYKYDVELTLPTAVWSTTGDKIGESSGEVEQRTTNIFTLIQNCRTDKGKIALNSTQNPENEDIRAGAKAMAHEFEKQFILGQTSTQSNPKSFKGLMRILAEMETQTTTDLDGAAGSNSQVIANSATSGALTMAKVDELIDAIKGGKPDMLLMSRLSRRKLSALQRASGSGVVMTEPNQFGLRVPTYDGIPIVISDWMPDNIQDGSGSALAIASYDPNVAYASGYDNGIIFALKIGDQDVTGLNAGEMTHERETFSEDYNAITNRFVWYMGLACFKKYSLAGLINIDVDA
jgi:HK97 family phage major capsid protein